jgi:hypothetical protein
MDRNEIPAVTSIDAYDDGWKRSGAAAADKSA